MAGIDQYTKLMLHCNGVDESTTFIDSSESEHTVTAHGDAQIDTAQYKFGGASGLFDGDNDYLSIPDDDDSFNFGSEDWTIDFWAKKASLSSTTHLVGQWEFGDNKMLSIRIINTNVFDMEYRTSGGSNVTVASTFTLSDTDWHHYAVIRDGNTLRFFVDGDAKGTADFTGITLNNASRTFLVSSMGDGFQSMNGWLDEVRISKGIARWTTDFTPPDSEYTPDAFKVDFEEDIILDDDWKIQTNPEQQSTEDTIVIDDDWLIQSNPEQENIEETVTLDDNWNVSTLEYSHFASKIISYNPLIYVTNSNPAKIIKVDISDPENPIRYTHTIINNSYAKDVVFNSTNDYFYIVCSDGKIVKINKNDLDDQTIIDTLDNDILLNIDTIDSSLLTFSSTNNNYGEIIILDEREIKKINIDIRWTQQIIKIISTQLNNILGKLISFDLRWRASISKVVKIDLRWLKSTYDDIFKFPISYTDWEVYINGTELTIIDDVDMNSILITHDITQEEEKASQAQFILNRRHDKLNYTNTGLVSEINNHNEVIIKIKGITEFTGKISNLNCISETETINVIAVGTRPSDKRHTVNIPMPSLNEPLHLYHCLINNIAINNPYINPNDKNPEYYKGIQINLGTEIKQNILRYSSFLNVNALAKEIEEGEFTAKQNWTYFWFAEFQNFITGRIQATLQYIGTSLGSLSTDAWKINGCSYKYQKELGDTEKELGIYQIGEAPYDEISVKNGKKIVKDRWVDKNDGLYRVRDDSYNYVEYAKRVANLEYEKLLNINGEVLPKTSADITLSIDAYYYYGISLLTRINVTNTTTANIYNNQNGFPVSVKNIRIQCSKEGENTMVVVLTCDNAKSQLELEEIDAQYPDENSDEFVFPEEEILNYKKFDPNSWSYIL